MNEYKFIERAYAKIIFHVAKYPHLAVNGILLADKRREGSIIKIVDAIPLFHQCLFLTPMVEVALLQIDAFAERENLVIAGYYTAAENFYDNTLERAPGTKIADKILEHNRSSCLALVDNKLVTLEHNRPALRVFSSTGDSGRWSKANFGVVQAEATLCLVSSLLKRGAMRDIVDFDNHLDNPAKDWRNVFLNKDLTELMDMY